MRKSVDMELLSSETEIKFDEVYTEHFPSPENRLLLQIQALWKSSWKDCKVGNFESIIQSTTFPTELRSAFLSRTFPSFEDVFLSGFTVILYYHMNVTVENATMPKFYCKDLDYCSNSATDFCNFFRSNSRSTLIGI